MEESDMNMIETDCGTYIRLLVEGRIDVTTSPKLQAQILNCFQKKNELVVDFLNVEYISSAGLRALLIGQKTALSKKGKMEIVNVSKDVMTVLNMTGFNKILTIK